MKLRTILTMLVLVLAVTGFAQAPQSSNKGLSDDFRHPQLTHYPNPAQNTLVVKAPITTEAAQLDVLDLTGKTVLHFEFATYQGELILIDIDALPKGTYVIRLNEYQSRLLKS